MIFDLSGKYVQTSMFVGQIPIESITHPSFNSKKENSAKKQTKKVIENAWHVETSLKKATLNCVFIYKKRILLWDITLKLSIKLESSHWGWFVSSSITTINPQHTLITHQNIGEYNHVPSNNNWLSSCSSQINNKSHACSTCLTSSFLSFHHLWSITFSIIHVLFCVVFNF